MPAIIDGEGGNMKLDVRSPRNDNKKDPKPKTITKTMAPQTTIWGDTVTMDSKGNYVYTSPSGAKVTTTFAPDEYVRDFGAGMAMYHPALQGAADARGVHLYTASVGGRYLSTPEYDAQYLGRYSPLDMDASVRHMNPWEFAAAYAQERNGQAVNWDKAGYANAYSPIPSDVQQLQQFFKNNGLEYNGYLPSGYLEWLQRQMGGTQPTQPTTPTQPTQPQQQQPDPYALASAILSQLPPIPAPPQQNIDWTSIMSMMLPMMMNSTQRPSYGYGYGSFSYPMMGYGYGF